MRKWTVVALIGLLGLFVSAPIVAQDKPKLTPWVCPKGFEGQKLNVFNWSTYIGENTIADFQKLCQVTVTYDVYESDDALLTKLRQGNPGYDIVVPGDASVPLMIKEALLEKLDFSKIPNYANIGKAYKNTPFDPQHEYAIPYLSGTLGLGYNRKAVGETVTSWQQFFNYTGKVAWLDDSRAMMPIALAVVGLNPNSADPKDIKVARDFLIQHGKNVAVIAQDDGQELLARGEVDMVIEYNGDIFQIGQECQCDTYAYALPKEGAAFSSGWLGIPKGAQNPKLAHVFLDYLLDPQVGADIANYTTYPTPNQAAIDAKLINQDLLANKGIYPDDATLARLFYILTPPEAEQLYSDAWDEVKVAVSRG
jgi:spermidine/putrescine transport system substrate-binding protein